MVTKFLNIDTDNTLSANSNERVPSQKAVKSYTDTLATPKQDKVLTTPIEIDSDEETTVEGALGAISTNLTEKQNQSLSSVITVDGTQQTTVEGALNAINIVAGSAIQPSDLATVATTGSYNDLLDKPIIPAGQVQSNWDESDESDVSYIQNKPVLGTMAAENAADYTKTANLANVALSGDYDDLTNKPTIPAAQVQSDWDESDESDVAYIKNKPYIPSEVIVDQTYDSTSTHAQSGTAVAQAISTKQDTLTAGDNITISSNVISANVPANVYTADNLLPGENVTFVPQIAQKLVTYTSYNTYIYKSSISTSSSYTYEYQIKFTYIPTGNYQCLGVFNASSTGNTGPWGMYIDDAGTNIVSVEHLKNDSVQYRATASTTLVSGTTYWLKLLCDGTEHYNVKYSTDGETWADLIPYYSAGGTMSYTTANFYIGAAYWTANGASQRWLHNTFDLNQTYLKINGNYILNGQDSSTYTKVGSPTIVNYTSGTTVNAKDTTYTAGTGISITEDSDENLVISNTQTSAEWGNISGTLSNQTDLQNALNAKQDTLVSGTNIKTVNSNSLLGSGNIDIETLPSQTGQSGKFLTTDGTDASWSDKPLVNNTTHGLSILGTSSNTHSSTSIGKYSSASGIGSVAISDSYGTATASGMYATCVGGDSEAAGTAATAFGNHAKATANYAVQLGYGTNSEANSFYVSTSTSNNWKMLGSDGTIPSARLNTMTGADGTNAGAKGAVPAPAATDNTKFLKGDGTWAAVDALPSQAGQSGKYLTTNGTAASWSNPVAAIIREW